MKEKWGWIGSNGVQNQTFDTSIGAILEMNKRMGREASLRELHDMGFKLALVRVTVEPIMVMTPFVESGGDDNGQEGERGKGKGGGKGC